MLKVMTIVGTRPELIKMCRVITEFDKHTDHILVHTGQNYDYELNKIFFDDLGIRKPDHFLDAAGKSAAQTIGRVIEKADEVMCSTMPDAVLFYGDTNSCLAVISAKRRKIPVFHMEAGNRCFDERVPEELNRKVLDHLSDINLVLSEHARLNLISEGIRAETILKTGSHMFEVLEFYRENIEASVILNTLNLEKGKYIIVSAHREENVDVEEKITSFVDSLNGLASEYNCPIIVSTHPRTRKRLEELNLEKDLHNLVSFLKPFGFFDYIKLQMQALCVISDSGTIVEESSLLNLPAIMIREAHERPEGMDAGVLIMSNLDRNSIISSVKVVLEQHDRKQQVLGHIVDYQSRAVSKQILRIVSSYVEYVNRTVWRKYN